MLEEPLDKPIRYLFYLVEILSKHVGRATSYIENGITKTRKYPKQRGNIGQFLELMSVKQIQK